MVENSSTAAIAEVAVSGFKSFRTEQRIAIRPLTLLAGANNSGKSSIVQPLLLMKQTFEAEFNPGALLLDGPNVRFTKLEQLLWHGPPGDTASRFAVELALEDGRRVRTVFGPGEHPLPVQVLETRWESRDGVVALRVPAPPEQYQEIEQRFGVTEFFSEPCFVWAGSRRDAEQRRVVPQDSSDFVQPLIGVIHVSGNRGAPKLSYPLTGVARERFPGVFEPYVATFLLIWQHQRAFEESERLAEALRSVCQVGSVRADRVSDTSLELLVSQLPDYSDREVNIAHAGLGVSQVLPVIVGLEAASPQQLLYLEQPELHLHPRAQASLAPLLARAAQRGVRVVAETHSSHLLLGIQSLVAAGKLDPQLVKLHWFSRDETGQTNITSADLDEYGRFGDWPEDFGDVELKAESRYLDAVEARHAKK